MSDFVISLETALDSIPDFDEALALILKAKERKARIFFIGNGGSAAIASHMAADYLKNGGMRATCFSDAVAMTCISNDLGFESVFALQFATHAEPTDILVAISSSGQSQNILEAVNTARGDVITLSGFDPDNALRKMGTINFYVPSSRYGVVEITHLVILHAILDKVMEMADAHET